MALAWIWGWFEIGLWLGYGDEEEPPLLFQEESATLLQLLGGVVWFLGFLLVAVIME